jgi:hypothetical protein
LLDDAPNTNDAPQTIDCDLQLRPEIFRPHGIVNRVARWLFFKQKIPVWVNFGGHWNGKGCYILCPFGICILWPFGTFYGHSVIWWQFDIYPVLVYCVKKSGNPDCERELPVTLLLNESLQLEFARIPQCV